MFDYEDCMDYCASETEDCREYAEDLSYDAIGFDW